MSGLESAQCEDFDDGEAGIEGASGGGLPASGAVKVRRFELLRSCLHSEHENTREECLGSMGNSFLDVLL